MKQILLIVLLSTLTLFSQNLLEEILKKERELQFLSKKIGEISNESNKIYLSGTALEIFHSKKDLIEKTNEQLNTGYYHINSFLKDYRSLKIKHKYDKICFEPIFDNLKDKFGRSYKFAEEELNVIENLKSEISTELKDNVGKIGTRSGELEREKWDDYLETFSDSLFNYLISDIDKDSDNMTRALKTISGINLKKKQVMLTFDDGPHYKYTSKILDILEEKEIPAMFFQVTKNIADITDTLNYDFKFRKNSLISKRIHNNPLFLLASHSNSHPDLKAIDSSQAIKEIDYSFYILDTLTEKRNTLFRPPYGSYNETVYNHLQKRNSKPFLWNIDSRDWADKVPESIAHTVISETKRWGKGVILLHDIHKQTLDALPMIIDSLVQNEYEFVLWDGKEVLNKKKLQKREKPKNSNFYAQKHALVIGINDYNYLPNLSYAVADARGIKTLLLDKLGFEEKNIQLIENGEATRQNIFSIINNNFSEEKVDVNDAVFIFYAGHGLTLDLSNGNKAGFIAPVNSDRYLKNGNAISMTEIEYFNEIIPAKHVFWIMDACYSGLALTRSSGNSRYIEQITSRKGRQILTAGGADEEVADGGPEGHSIFTWNLIKGLEGAADLNGDRYITASELFNYVPEQVSLMSTQTPAFGNLVGSEGGDFVFELQEGFNELSKSSNQYSDSNIELLNEIKKLKEQITALETKNTPDTNSHVYYNNLGLEYYRKKDYENAILFFKKSIDQDNNYVEAINNLGFVYYKNSDYENALKYVQKAIELDPERKTAYLNLADIYFELNQKEKAKENYLIYLETAKDNDFKKKIQDKINTLD